jgi:glycosyl hydrolase family 10
VRVAMEVSYSDFPQNWGKSRETWGPSAVRHIIDKICQAGIRRIHWRLSCSGDFNYPTRVKGAGKAYAVNGDFGQCHGGIDFDEFDSLRVAVDYAHTKGMELVAWFDQMDSHYTPGDPCSTSSQFLRDHPQFAHKLRGGRPQPDPGAWTSSISYPEVVEYRLETLREMINDYGVDGLYLVFVNQIGYEEPNVDSFRAKYGQDPNQIPEDDPRWIAHRAQEVLLPYLRRVKGVIEQSGRPVELMIEGQGSVAGLDMPMPDEPGWSEIPSYARANEIIQAARSKIANEKLADILVYWSFTDLEQVDEDLRIKIGLGTRYRIWQRKTREEICARLKGAAERGVRLFTINEATPIEMFDQWEVIHDLLTDLLSVPKIRTT